MARVESHTATRKEHRCQRCSEPIAKGQEYYTWSPGFRVQPRYQHKTHGAPRASQRTGNDKLSTLYGVAEEYRESASNIEEGFQHSTSASEEAEDNGSQCDDAAQEMDGVAATLESAARDLEEALDGLTALGLEPTALPENAEGDIQAAIEAYDSAVSGTESAISEAEGLSCPL